MRHPSFELRSLLVALPLMVAEPSASVAGVARTAATSFTDVGAGLQGVYNSSVAWGDYDNDGDLDILLTGFIGGSSITRLYRNSGGASPTFSDAGAALTAVQSSSVAWGDYDNDGDLDILLTGFAASGPVTKLYQNSGGANPAFSDVGAVLTDVQVSSVAWGDYDNDGDLDILLTGADVNFASVTKLYRNNGGPNPTFTDVGAALDNVQQSSVAWGDYDNDGDLDILITGFTNTNTRIAKVYRNSGGANPTFSDVGAGLTGVYLSSVAWGDYDNDGDLDVLLTGNTGTTNIAKLYRNSGGANPTFSDVAASLDGVNTPSVAWGDYDNDGDLDILLTGFTGTARITKLYQSSGGVNPTFSDAGAGLVNVQRSSVAWGDYDNDGDLDVLLTGYDPGNIPTSKLYRSDGALPNTPPIAPGGLTATTGPSGTTFSWSGASDAQTPVAGLTYNLRVGTTPGGNEVSSSMAAGNGYRRVVRLGGANHDLSWRLRLPAGTYYWSVQAVDGAFAGSPFAVEHSFGVTGFTDIGAGLTGVASSGAAWGDYDNDGDLDILLVGQTVTLPVSLVAKIYRNDGGGSFTDIGAPLTGVKGAAVAWADYDNDGDLDFVLTGEDASSAAVTKLYRNDRGGTFTEIPAGLVGLKGSSVDWGDYDGDGDLDILLSGIAAGPTLSTKLYRNDGGGTFTDSGVSLIGVSYGSVSWSDFDNDGDLDILAVGFDPNGVRTATLYRNEGNGTFTNIGGSIHGAYECSVAWGDYDNDGDLDVLVAGIISPPPSIVPASIVYRNDGGGVFTEVVLDALPGVWGASVAWGDYDNDGLVDALVSGEESGFIDQFLIAKAFKNLGNGFFNMVTDSLQGIYQGSVAWGDYDNDGDLDVLLAGSAVAKVYRNDGQPTNVPPAPPGNLSAVRNGDLVTFSWTAASDDHTPAPGLSYNLRVGTSPGGDQNVSAMAAPTGYRRVPRLGNAQQRTSWTLAIPPGPYYWSVQAVDGAFQGSSFASATVAVDGTQELPSTFDLDPPVPNPFASEVALNFALPRSGPVEIAVFDLAGRRLQVLEQGRRSAGRHRLVWDGRDESGVRERNGIYLVRMTAAGNSWTRKLVLAR